MQGAKGSVAQLAKAAAGVAQKNAVQGKHTVPRTATELAKTARTLREDGPALCAYIKAIPVDQYLGS